MVKVSTPIFQLKVRVGGKNIQEYHKDNLTFVEGKPGSIFELVLKNLTGETILAHPTVDGRSVMNGKLAKRNDSSDGYVLHGWRESIIPGWRLDQKSVAHFFFTGREELTYGEQMGDSGENKGVIACAIWQEYRPPKWISSPLVYEGLGHFNPINSGCYHSPNSHLDSFGEKEIKCSGGILRSANSVNNIGAGFGEKTQHGVSHVHFRPATVEPIVVATIYYDDLAGLRARGLKIGNKRPKKKHLPNPFPADQYSCQPPPGWKE